MTRRDTHYFVSFQIENGHEYPYYNYQNDLEGYTPQEQAQVPNNDFLSYLANYQSQTQTRQDLTDIEPLLVRIFLLRFIGLDL